MLSSLKKLTFGRVIGILHYAAIILMAALFVYSLFTWIYTSDVWGFGGIFWSSWMTLAFVYIGVAIFLRINEVPDAEGFIISLTSAISMIWLYEILFHFSFWDSWNYGNPPYFLLKENTIFLNYGLISLSALTGYRFMKANRWFWLVLITMTVLWVFWITIGFPLFYSPQTLYDFAWPRLIINNPHALAFSLNSITKLLLGAAYVLLQLPSRQKLSETKKAVKRFLTERGILDDVRSSEVQPA